MADQHDETSSAGGTGDAPVRHLYLVDGAGYIFRAYHKLPATMSRADGTPTHAAYGFTNMLLKLLREIGDHDALAVVFDADGRSFRNDIYEAYKANRPPMPEDLKPQIEICHEAVRAMNLPCLEQQGYEADDIIATLARRAQAAGAEVTIVSSDKDLMQLLAHGVRMLDPMDFRPIGREDVEKKFGVPPEKVVDVQALWGDSTDNVPGVPGIGQKIAAQLIEDYGDLDTLLTRADEIKQKKRRENLLENAEQARISRRLVQLCEDMDLRVDLSELRLREPDNEALRRFLAENEFHSIINRLGLDSEDAETPPAEAEASYELVQDRARLDAWIAEADRTGRVAVDLETTSLDAMRARLVGICLATAPGRACYVPVGHTASGRLDDEQAAPQQIDRDAALKALKPLLEDPGVLKIGQNIKYDRVVLLNHGVAVTPIDDTMLLSYVLEAGLHGHGMDELARHHLNMETTTYKEVAGTGKNQVTFDKVPLDKARDYAAEDADITFRLHAVLKPRLVPEHMCTVYETLERPLSDVLARMEREGIKVDPAVLSEMSRDFGARMHELEQEIHRLAGHPFNVGSPKQLGEVLFDELGLEGGKRGKSGTYSTDAEVLQGLAAQGHDLPARVLDWRQIQKLKSTYTDALQDDINPETGRIHTAYQQAVASTGRLSSTDPNLQNIPIRTEEGRKIRQAFIAEDGHQLLSVDYSQIELRLAAHVADEPSLKQAFRDDIDIHAKTASEVFDVKLEDMDATTRRAAKAINFGIIYGISAYGLSQNLGVDQKAAKRYIDTYFERYPNIKAYMDSMRAWAREHGHVTTMFGRRIHIPEIQSKSFARRSFAERAAINAPIQGSAADIIKRAMIRLPAALADAGLSARMLLQVHDELLFEVPDGEMDATISAVRRVMEHAHEPAVDLTVPLEAEAGTGASWAAAH
ncbi:DNA polymerase I [Limimonas halophila]|uniref:DNA polymerase I n=1 Tax=Limimonas halophila TaxID=1082479 RepID=A0A1G7SKL1_9PROT|nr:DNA polymerase I [Limimonas halophila]SDG22949.1 DNA polymerase I [Limimonas halophila]